eukprot:329107-Chlamydomonas_euryale.AAC.26
MICEGYNDLLLGLGGEITVDSKFYYSIDGVKWMDLPAIDGATASRAANINALLAGDAAKAYHVEEDGPIQTASGEDTKDPAAEPGEGERVETKLTFSIPELAVLRQRVDAINTACGVIPVVRRGGPSHCHLEAQGFSGPCLIDMKGVMERIVTNTSLDFKKAHACISKVLQVRTICIIRIRIIRCMYVPEKSQSRSGPHPATCHPAVAAAAPACACSRLAKTRPLAYYGYGYGVTCLISFSASYT